MKFKRIFLVFISMLLFSCSDESFYKVKDAGMSAVDGSINWLDNERVIFVNKDAPGSGKIYIWNTKTGVTELYAPEALGGICYSDGYITYGIKIEDNTTYIKTGKIGEEELVVFDWDDEELRKVQKNRYSCKRFIPPEEHRDKNIHYLKEGHGYIELGTKRKNEYEFPVYISPEGERIKIDYRYDWYYNRPQNYYSFRGGYFIFKPFFPVWDGSGCNPGIWIYPDGEIESECIPFISAVKNYGDAIPVSSGYLIVSYQVESNTEVGESGIYYFNKKMNDISLVYPGINEGVSVSPNGCKVAFLHNPVVNKNKLLKMIKLCN